MCIRWEKSPHSWLFLWISHRDEHSNVHREANHAASGIFFVQGNPCPSTITIISLRFLVTVCNCDQSVTLSLQWARGVYFWKFNPPLFAGLSLPQTEIRPKHNEGVIWAQNKCYFWIQHPWKPLYREFVQPSLWF